MKKKTLLLASIILMLSLNSCDSRPVAQFAETTHDFGKVQKNSTLKYTFNFTNKGNSTLIIERIKAGWGCTGTLLSEREIPAGGSGKLEVELHTEEREGDFSRSISVYTNDPERDIIRLIIRAFIVK